MILMTTRTQVSYLDENAMTSHKHWTANYFLGHGVQQIQQLVHLIPTDSDFLVN